MTARDKLEVYVKPKDQKLNSLDKKYLYNLITQKRLEKLPIVDSENNIIGLATEQDLYRWKNQNLSNINSFGQLYTAAAIGCREDYLQRADALV